MPNAATMAISTRSSRSSTRRKQRVSECEQTQGRMNDGDEQHAKPGGDPDAPSGESKNRHEGDRGRQYKRCRRGEAWIRRHRTTTEAISAAVIAAFTAALFATSISQWKATRDTLR